MTAPLLNPAQRAAVAIGLRETEEVLRAALADIDRREQGRLYDRYTSAPAVKRARVAHLIVAVLREVSELADTLAIEQQRQDPLAELAGQAAVLWSNLIDLRADKLQRYGKVAPTVAEKLNPPLNRMITLLDQLIHVLAESGDA